ncbi:hypothetical protein [Clostridium sp.]|uniref:hypothetical protein n=1 Tax=Clostridium sp. TaxID=1506 RepID=UPI003D6C7F33
MMEEKISEIVEEQDLKACIDTLRDILNEMCCKFDEREVNKEKLNVSHQLDILIVRYMGLKK